MSERWTRILHFAILLVLVLIVYRNSFQSGWVGDNKPIIQLNPRNKDASLENLRLIWEKNYWWPLTGTLAYRPIISTTYLLEWSVFGYGRHEDPADQVVGFHWLNLAAHGINALLVYCLILKLLELESLAFLSAALFALHPITTESVTNIVGRADEFAAISVLGCTLLYIRSTRFSGPRRLMWLVLVTILFAFGCFSKESAVAFAAIPIAFDAIYRWDTEEYRGQLRRRILADLPSYGLILIPAAALLIARWAVFRSDPPAFVPFVDNPMTAYLWNHDLPFSSNLHSWFLGEITAAKVVGASLWKLVWPMRLSWDYSYNQIKLFEGNLRDIEALKALTAVLIIAGAGILSFAWRKKYKPVSFLILFYAIVYLPTSGFLITGTSIMAERFLYLPSVAFCALLVLTVDRMFRVTGWLDHNRSWRRFVPAGILLLIATFYGFRTYARNFDWRSDVTISEAAIKAAPESFRSYFLLAQSYYEMDPSGLLGTSIDLAERGLAILDRLPDDRNSSLPYVQTGVYYGSKGGQVAERKAGRLVMNDDARKSFTKSAAVLEHAALVDQAANQRDRAIGIRKLRPDVRDVGLTDIYTYLGIAYVRLDMNEKALEAFRYWRYLNPSDAAAYDAVASTQLALGQLEPAAVSFLQCLALDPNRKDAWDELTAIYSEINHEPVPAIQITGGVRELKEDNALVRRHLLAAYTGLANFARSSGNPDFVRYVRNAGINLHHFSSDQLDAASLPAERPAPPIPAFFHTSIGQ